MKKMSFTNSELKGWLLSMGKSAFLILFALSFIGLGSAEAQIKHPVGLRDKTVKFKIETCAGANVQYTDDNSVDAKLYSDFGTLANGNATTNSRSDTVEICPQDRWHNVTVTFTEFDINTNDFLRVYDGSFDSLRADGAGAVYKHNLNGTGVSAANGGWVAADCSPDVNPTGCLTFVFQTDALANDNSKGLGWDAWVTCANRNIRFGSVNIQNQKVDCIAPGATAAANASTAPIVIPRPSFFRTNCGSISGNTRVTLTVKKADGTVCFTTTYPNFNAIPANVNIGRFGVGYYTAEFFVTGDPSKTTGPKIFSVSLPALACNDEVVIPLGSACAVEVTLDDILENPCDTAATPFLEYGLRLTFGSGKNQVITGTGSTVNAWPIITRQMLQDLAKNAGTDLTCGGTAEVEVIRVYTPMGMRQCDNGEQRTSCKTTIRFKDETAPIPTVSLSIGGGAVDTLIACDTESLRKLIKIGAIDNCDIKDTTVSIRLEETDPCFDSGGLLGPDTTRAFVRVTATDKCGNTRSINKTYIVLRPQTFAAPKNGRFECDKSGNTTRQLPGLRVGYVNAMGNDVITDTIYKLSETEYFCGYILRSDRDSLPATDCGDKEFIRWSYLDWCTPSQGLTAISTQFIEYIDTKKPNFVDTTATRPNIRNSLTNANSFVRPKPKLIKTPAMVSLGHFECTFDANKLPRPVAIDNCDKNVTVSISQVLWVNADGVIDNRSPRPSASALKCGTYYIVWKADDVCHEQQVSDFAYQFLTVKDDTKPSAVATDQLNISIPNAWGARICVDDIDAGSFDACGIKERGIRIKGKGGPYTKCVDIGCEFVHPDLQIELRIVDEKGNFNLAWTDILAEDKIAPICDNLPNRERNCDEFHNEQLGKSTDTDGDRKFEDSEWVVLSAELQAIYNKEFGTFKCVDNLDGAQCGELTRVEEYQLIEWPCGEIEIRRRIRATDWSQLTSAPATQSIKLVYKAGWKITLPDDAEGKCKEAPEGKSVVINNGACDLLGFEVSDKRFDVPGDACYKIERTYHIINWCKYKAGEDPIELARREGEHGKATGFMVTSEGNEDKGYFTYVQILKVHDDEGPVVTVMDPDPCINGVDFDALPYGEEDITPGVAPYECDELKTWTATATDCSSQDAITWEGKLFDANGNVVATSKTNTIRFVVTNKSTYTAEFWAYDGCGNSGGKKGNTLKFWDCKKPTPYAINGIAIEMMQTGTIAVWATDIDQGSFDNCTDQSKLDLRIWHATLGDAPTTKEGVKALPKVVNFTCTELGTQNVHLYAMDEEENYDFVQTYVIVQDNMGACGNVEGGMVAGNIVDGNGDMVESVSIAVNGADQRNMTTSADGQYQFRLPTGGDYTITPQKDMNPLNGVSTFDLVLISKHILGISTFDTPYKYIAADVNKSGSITAFDMVQLRQLILNITSEFPNNDSWRFVDGEYTFTSANPAAESFNEFVSINNLSSDRMHMDFTAVKIGDVNGNASANSLLGAESRTTNGTLNLNVADRFVEAGQTVTVEFTAADIASATGYQFTLNVAGAANVIEGVAKAANFNTNLAARGVLATSWNGEATANDVLFAIDFTANTTGLLSEMVSISSDVVAAEAYNADGDLMNVNIEFGAATAVGFELNQNTPNPFNAETLIGFNLPVAGSATLTVMDVQGKVLKAITADYAKGYNQVSLNANELGATGVLYYQLESADNVATKKMIIIE